MTQSMPEAMLFDDVEALLVGYLAPLLGERFGATVATNTPNPRPDWLVKVTRTGGTQRDRITDLPQVTFECWAPSEPEAYSLIRMTRALVWAMASVEIDDVWVRAVTEVGGPAFTPDPETTLPRYQYTVELNLRGRTKPVIPTEFFDWEFRAIGRTTSATSQYLSLVVTGGVLPAGTYHWAQDYNSANYAPEDDFTVATDLTSGAATDFLGAYIPTGTDGTLTITGPYGIEIVATGTIPGLQVHDEAVIDSDTETYIRS